MTAKQRGRLEAAAGARAAALIEQRREYRREQERMTAGRTTRPLNVREVVAAWWGPDAHPQTWNVVRSLCLCPLRRPPGRSRILYPKPYTLNPEP